jgi:hypothetical protein
LFPRAVYYVALKTSHSSTCVMSSCDFADVLTPCGPLEHLLRG